MRSALRWLVLALLIGLPAQAGRAAGPTDPAELDAFLAGLLPSLLETYHVPGAVFVLVKDGEVFLAKGYGYADVETRRPVDPETTIFRVASVSKLFTATAAMQLVEQGKLDLHADVNRTLEGFRIEEAFGEPVTLHHLLTHTAGFDDRFLETSLPIGTPLPPLGDYLAARMPRRVTPPGKILSYSNHGMALVGHLVERASGLSFDEYMQRSVYEPLGMTRSRFGVAVPVPPEMAVPYAWRDGRQTPLGYDHDQMGPAAELATTGTDIARFMIAHLQLGRFGDRRILSEETARLMHARHFSHHPDLDGWCYGFAEIHRNGVRGIGHGGDWRGFRTDLMLFPEAGFGYFLSLNGAFEGPFFETFDETFADHYLPVEPQRAAPPADFASRAGEYSGTYVPNRRDRGSFLKLGEWLFAARVVPNDDATLGFTSSQLPALRMAEVGPDRFREVDGETDAAFLRDRDGKLTHLAVEWFAFDRVPPWRSPLVHRGLALALLLLFAVTPAGWALGAVARGLAGGSPSPLTPPARWLGSLVCVLDAAALIGAGVFLTTADLFELFIEVPATLKLFLWLPVLSLPVSLALPWFALRGFRRGAQAPLARLHYWLLAAAALLYLMIAWYWNLLGYRS